jgi:hypothetical protein
MALMRSNSRSMCWPVTSRPWASSTALFRSFMSCAVANSQRAPRRSGPPTMCPAERNRSCTSFLAA